MSWNMRHCRLLIIGAILAAAAFGPFFPAHATTCITVTPTEDLSAIVSAATDDTVITLTAGTFNLVGHAPYNQGVWIGDKNGLTITGQGWQRTKIKLPSDLNIGFYVYSNVHRLTIEGIHFEGTLPLQTNTHAIGSYSSTTNVTNVVFRNLRISDVAVGINIGSSPSGVYDQVEISRNIVTDTVGTEPGWGYGVVCGNSSNVLIERNFIRNATRHGIYFARSARGSNIVINNNFIYDHDYFKAQPLRVASALVCARSSDVRIAHNVVLNPRTYGLSVEPDDVLGWPTVDITLLNNQVLGAYDVGIWIDTGETHTALGNSVVLQPGNPYWELEYTNESQLTIPDARWEDADYFFDFVSELNGYVYVLKNGILDRITPNSWKYESSPDDWTGASAMTAVTGAAPGTGRLYLGKGNDLFAVNPEDWTAQLISSSGSHLIMVSTVPLTNEWVADGVTEYRLDVYGDTTQIPDKAFFLAEWDLVVPEFLTITRAELPSSDGRPPVLGQPPASNPNDFFYRLKMDPACNRVDSTIANGEADDNVRMVQNVFIGVPNRIGILGSYCFTVNPGAPAGTAHFALNQVTFAATDFMVYTDLDGVRVSNASFTIVADDTPPLPPVVQCETPTGDITPSWRWTSGGGGNGTFRCRLDNGAWTETTAMTYTPATALHIGRHVLEVQERDAAGNWSLPGAKAILIDTAPPAAPTVTAKTPTRDTTPIWRWKSGGGGNGIFRYRLDDGTWTETASRTYTSATALSEGRHVFRVKERDAAGNWSLPGAKAILIDTAPPAAPTVTAKTPTRDTTPAWRWKSGGGGNGIFRYRLDDGTWTETASRTYTPAIALSEGRHTLYVQERDSACNWSVSGKKMIDIASGRRIYVSPRGDDSAPGTFSEPVETLTRARDMIREIKAGGPLTEPITVFLRGGLYRLTEALKLDGRDAGAPTAPIRYQSYLDERPVISGGAPITGPWRAYSPGIYVANVGSRRFSSLFVDGQRAIRAREPDVSESFPYYRIVRREECLYSEPLDTPAECYDRFKFRAGDVKSTWLHLTDIEVVQLAMFVQPRFRLARVDDAGQLAFVTRGGGSIFFGYDYEGTDRYYIENFFEGLDTPGEWYLDATNGDLYYWPLPDRPIEQSRFIAPVVGQLLQLGDFPAVEAITVSRYGEYDDPRLGFEQSDFSISVWMRFPTTGENPGWPLTKGPVFWGIGYGIAAWSEDGGDPVPVGFYINDGSGLLGVQAGSLLRGQWGHFAFTVDRANKVITSYKDGIFVEKLDLPSTFGDIGTNYPLEIGRYAGLFNFEGAMDELRLFDCVLSPEDVKSLYDDNTAPGRAPVLEHSFNENLVNTAPDPAVGSWHGLLSFIDGQFEKALNFHAVTESITSHPGYVHDLTIAGIDLMHTDWSFGPKGFAGALMTYPFENTAALAIAGTDVKIENCRIMHTGTDAVRILGQRVTVCRSELSDIGVRGVVLGGFPGGSNFQVLASLATDNRIEDNSIHSFGRVIREGSGIALTFGTGNQFAHNRIFDGPYDGIFAGWQDPAPAASSGANLFEFNEISDVMRSLNDGGGIYVVGVQPGTIIRNNVVHDIVSTGEHVYDLCIWGIYLDGTAAEMLVRDNLVYRTQWGGIMLNLAAVGNRDNYVTNNILVDGTDYQVYFNFASRDRFERNIVYTGNDAPFFGVITPDAIGVSDYNLFYPASLSDPSSEWSRWRSLGFDAHSIVVDPGFVDYYNDDFTVPDTSPAVTQLGFVMPDFSDVGPRHEKHR